MKLTTIVLLLLVALVVFGIQDVFGQLTWTKYAGNPVMQPGQSGSWDGREIYPGPVLFRDSVYHLWYIGWDGTDTWRYNRTGYARSTNGINWTKHATPVLDVGASGAWDYYDAEAGAVLYDGGQYKMWYNGYATASFYLQVGYATGVNETTWTKRAPPILSPGPSGAWDVAGVMYTSVLRSSPGGGFKMWYTGWDGSKLVDGMLSNFQIGYATATDETTWTKNQLNPVLKLGSAGQWDDAKVHLPMVLNDSAAGLYYMFYTGMNRATEVQRIGVASSRDGIAWTKYSGNPILAPGPTGSWDAKTLVIGGVVMVRDTFRLWYTGVNANGVTRFGYATSPRIPVGITEGTRDLPQSCMLLQNFPNPFNPTTVVSYQLPVASNVRLVVYDLVGREVAVLLNERKAPGSYNARFDATGLASGVYLYRLTAGTFVHTRNMTLVK